MKPTSLMVCTATATMLLASPCARAATMMANTSNKGSLLIYPRIDVTTGVDTLLTVVNDGSTDVHVKCYYRSTERIPTPLPSTFDVSFLAHTMDFTLVLTRNQTTTWSAATGQILGSGRMVAPPFAMWPDGTGRTTGEMKCWAMGNAPNGTVTQINFNQLFGTATVVGAPFGVAGSAYAYNAWAIQALAGTGAQGLPVGSTPGVLNLDGSVNGYDLCPNILVANFHPAGTPTPAIGPAFGGGAAATGLSIVGCTQDLTQRAQSFVTDYVYTFWNQDEYSRTGTRECGTSYYETVLPAASGVAAAPNAGPFAGMPLAQYAALGTPLAYMRIESLPDNYVCAGAARFGMLGVIARANGGQWVRGTNMIGRGTQAGRITYDPGPADSYKR